MTTPPLNTHPPPAAVTLRQRLADLQQALATVAVSGGDAHAKTVQQEALLKRIQQTTAQIERGGDGEKGFSIYA